MAADNLNLRDVLQTAGLSTLVAKFEGERMDVTMLQSLSDSDMIRLGVETIGDRVRLRHCAKQQVYILDYFLCSTHRGSVSYCTQLSLPSD